MSLHPEVRWAERENKVYLTVMLADAKDVKVNLHPDSVFTFSGTAGADNKCYELKLELFAKVDVEESVVNIGVKRIFCILMKAEKKWWNKLLRGDGKSPHYIKVDWDKWVEDDDDEVPADVDTGGMEFSKFGAMAGGLGGDSGNMGRGSGSMDGGTGQKDDTRDWPSDWPDMSDFNDDGFDFAGFGQDEDGRIFARYNSRWTAELMRRMGPERAKEWTEETLDPRNPEDAKKEIYI